MRALWMGLMLLAAGCGGADTAESNEETVTVGAESTTGAAADEDTSEVSSADGCVCPDDGFNAEDYGAGCDMDSPRRDDESCQSWCTRSAADPCCTGNGCDMCMTECNGGASDEET